MQAQHPGKHALTGAVRCILRDIGRSTGQPLDELAGKFDTRQTAAILGLTTPRTLDTWASRPDHGGLPFVKVGRSRRYLLSDSVAFIAGRRSDAKRFDGVILAEVICEQVDRLGPTVVGVAA